MKRIILDVLDYLFARKILLPINIIILKLVIRFIGYNNHKSLGSSGEKNFLNNVCKNKPQLCIDVGAILVNILNTSWRIVIQELLHLSLCLSLLIN